MKPNMKWWISLTVVACVMLTAALASAQQAQGLTAVGAPDPANGYPKWYIDRNGVQLAPCLVTPADDPCALAGTFPNPAAPIVFPTNFPDEFFYMRATARIDGIGGGIGRADLGYALEGAFGGATGTAADGAGAQIERPDSQGDAHQAGRLTVGKYVEQGSIRNVDTHFHSEGLSRRGVDRLDRSASGRGELLAVRSWRKTDSIATVRDGHVGRKREQHGGDHRQYDDCDCSHWCRPPRFVRVNQLSRLDHTPLRPGARAGFHGGRSGVSRIQATRCKPS